MPRTIQEAVAEQRRNLAQWVTMIITVFWSVWWGFFMNRVLVEGVELFKIPLPFVAPSVWLEIPKSTYLVINALIVSYFAVAYAHWLWNAQRTSYRRFLVRDLVKASVPLLLGEFFLLSSIGFAGAAFLISDALLFYGLLLTMLWPAVVLTTVWIV